MFKFFESFINAFKTLPVIPINGNVPFVACDMDRIARKVTMMVASGENMYLKMGMYATKEEIDELRKRVLNHVKK